MQTLEAKDKNADSEQEEAENHKGASEIMHV